MHPSKIYDLHEHLSVEDREYADGTPNFVVVWAGNHLEGYSNEVDAKLYLRGWHDCAVGITERMSTQDTPYHDGYVACRMLKHPQNTDAAGRSVDAEYCPTI